MNISRWPGDSKKFRTFCDFKFPTCMLITLQSNADPGYYQLITQTALMIVYPNLQINSAFQKKSDIGKHMDLVRCLEKHKPFDTMPRMQISKIGTDIDHFLQHCMTDNGDKVHDCCQESAVYLPNVEFEKVLYVLKILDVSFLLHNANVDQQIHKLIASFLFDKKYYDKQIKPYYHVAVITSRTEFDTYCDFFNVAQKSSKKKAFIQYLFLSVAQCPFSAILSP